MLRSKRRYHLLHESAFTCCTSPGDGSCRVESISKSNIYSEILGFSIIRQGLMKVLGRRCFIIWHIDILHDKIHLYESWSSRIQFQRLFVKVVFIFIYNKIVVGRIWRILFLLFHRYGYLYYFSYLGLIESSSSTWK